MRRRDQRTGENGREPTRYVKAELPLSKCVQLRDVASRTKRTQTDVIRDALEAEFARCRRCVPMPEADGT